MPIWICAGPRPCTAVPSTACRSRRCSDTGRQNWRASSVVAAQSRLTTFVSLAPAALSEKKSRLQDGMTCASLGWMNFLDAASKPLAPKRAPRQVCCRIRRFARSRCLRSGGCAGCRYTRTRRHSGKRIPGRLGRLDLWFALHRSRDRRIQSISRPGGPDGAIDRRSHHRDGQRREAAMGELSSLESRYGAANYKPLPVTLVRGEGVHVWDEDDRRYLDMMGAYSAVSFGHCHPHLVEAMTRQARRLDIVPRAYFTDQLGPFLARACALTGMDAALPANGGAEAVETALKAARKWAYKVKGVPAERAEIIVAEGNFHGRTIAIVGFSSVPQNRDGFGPFPAGF